MTLSDLVIKQGLKQVGPNVSHALALWLQISKVGMEPWFKKKTNRSDFFPKKLV